MINLKKINQIILVILSVSFFIVTIASIVFLYEKRNKILKKIFNLSDSKTYVPKKFDKKDEYWANKILEGGFILHFRHAERDKWIDVQMYDVLESHVHSNGLDNSRYAENDYFKDAVCLNSRGMIQARAMGEHIKNLRLPISLVVSSVSCRARQTAELAFGGYDILKKLLVHYGPYNEDAADLSKKLKNYYISLPVETTSNTIISAHNGLIKRDMFINETDIEDSLSLEEGGFYVISKKNGGLFLEHEFHFFKNFTSALYKR